MPVRGLRTVFALRPAFLIDAHPPAYWLRRRVCLPHQLLGCSCVRRFVFITLSALTPLGAIQGEFVACSTFLLVYLQEGRMCDIRFLFPHTVRDWLIPECRSPLRHRILYSAGCYPGGLVSLSPQLLFFPEDRNPRLAGQHETAEAAQFPDLSGLAMP